MSNGITYVVQKGDSLSKIAKKFGISDWRTIYNHSNNSNFKKTHSNPDIIFPNDTLFIPGVKPGVRVNTGRKIRLRPARKVLEITAKLKSTISARSKHSKPSSSFKKYYTFKSTSKQMSLSSNIPIVLVRNCNDIELEVTTSPANQTGVVWQVKANPGGSGSLPIIVPSGNKATLKTDASGGFAISASLEGTIIYWNIVLVEVEILRSKIVRKSNNFKDKSSSGWLTVSSGEFNLTTPSKCAMYTKAKVKFTAGGKTSLKSYCDKVHAGIVNCLLLTDAQGNYDPKGRVRERIPAQSGLPNPVSNPATVVTDVGYPVLDRGGSSATRATGGDTIFLSMTRSVPANGEERVVETCDSPAVGFPSHLPEHGKAATKKIKSNSGINSFKIYLVAYSDDAKFSYVAFGHGVWAADYSGTCTFGLAGTKPKWKKGTQCGITGTGAKLTPIKQGREAEKANCEVHPPVYLTYILDAR